MLDGQGALTHGDLSEQKGGQALAEGPWPHGRRCRSLGALGWVLGPIQDQVLIEPPAGAGPKLGAWNPVRNTAVPACLRQQFVEGRWGKDRPAPGLEFLGSTRRGMGRSQQSRGRVCSSEHRCRGNESLATVPDRRAILYDVAWDFGAFYFSQATLLVNNGKIAHARGGFFPLSGSPFAPLERSGGKEGRDVL